MSQQAVDVAFWSKGGASDTDPALHQAADSLLLLDPAARFYRGVLRVPADGMLVLSIRSPRPLRLWVGRSLVLDENLFWRLFNRAIDAAVIVPAVKGDVELLVEVGPRSRHPQHIDRDCPSRNRDHVMAELEKRIPDRLDLRASVVPGSRAPAASIRFTPSQFRRDGVVYQQTLVRPLTSAMAAPTIDRASAMAPSDVAIHLQTNVLPGEGIERSTEEWLRSGVRQFFVPVAEPGNMPAPLRGIGKDNRVEPSHAVARTLDLTIDGAGGGVTIPLPAFESTGRLAPRQEHRDYKWPTIQQIRQAAPQPVLPPQYSHFARLYDAAWDMFLKLLRDPAPETGAIGSYVATGSGFGLYQFVWDSSFTTMCMAYAWRAMNVYANLDNLYSRQFDGGYIHREHNWQDGLPAMYEPDFSPNPPIMSLAEWQIARLSGDLLRVRHVYEALKASHAWLRFNHRLDDGTYWTTCLANGLDNSPSLGDGYPCLTAQMAHEAEILSQMATVLGKTDEAAEFEREYAQTGESLNRHLWSDSMRIYSTSLPGGKHNPNKVATDFWPLWAGIVPSDRVADLAKHLKDPKSFWRHHPIPSLAADSPHFRLAGDYWLGSTWAPTNYAAIKGFDRSGRHDLAVETTLRHLTCMHEVFQATGEIWENYCSESSQRGSWSGAPYCWSALGPISLLLEVLIGLEPDALNRTIRWTIPAEAGMGVRNYPLGSATITLIRQQDDKGAYLEVSTDLPFTLVVVQDGEGHTIQCPAGASNPRLA